MNEERKMRERVKQLSSPTELAGSPVEWDCMLVVNIDQLYFSFSVIHGKLDYNDMFYVVLNGFPPHHISNAL